MSDERLKELGVHRIAVPVPFKAAGGPANVYVIEDVGGGVALFDAGIKSDEGEAALREGFAALDLSFRDVRRIIVSHGHVDHFGFAQAIIGEAGCPAFIHPRDRAKVTGPAPHVRNVGTYRAYLARLGLSQEQIDRVARAGDYAESFGPRLDAVQDLRGGETLRFARFEAEVLHLPGHTPGLVCLWDAAHRVLFADDHLLWKVSPNPLLDLSDGSEEGKFRALSTYLASVRKARDLPAELICPGHGEPFIGHQGLIDGLLQFYERRQAKLLEALGPGEQTALELVPALFGEIHASELYLQLSEVVGNLEVLEDQGRVGRRLDGPVYRFARA